MSKVHVAQHTSSNIGKQGENLVENAILSLLGWKPRKEEDDDGIDQYVEIPADSGRPSQRFLVQIKTSQTVRVKARDHWSITFRRAALSKYLKSRHPVFAFRVDLTKGTMRWLDVLAGARAYPTLTTFDLAPDRALNEESVHVFSEAVHAAIEALDDQYHPPAKALSYRSQQLEGMDPRFKVEAEFVRGQERYTLNVRPGNSASFSILPISEEDSRKIQAAVEYGSRATLKGRVRGLPSLHNDHNAESLLELSPRATSFRLGVSAERGDRKFYIELPGETSFGTRGIELRSADHQFPFRIRLQCDRDGTVGSYDLEMNWPVWDGLPVQELPLFEQTLEFARCMTGECRVRFDEIDYGVAKVLLTCVTENSGDESEQTFEFLELIDKLRQVTRELGVVAVFRQGIEVTPQEQQGILLAYRLFTEKEVTWEGMRYEFDLSSQGIEALPGLQGMKLDLHMPLHMRFAGTSIATIPVRADVSAFAIVFQEAGKLVIETLPGTTLSRA